MRMQLLIMIGLALFVRSAAAQEPTTTKTLGECIAIAVGNHPSLKAADASIEAGSQRVREAVSNYLPQINALYAANRRQSSPAVLTGAQTQNNCTTVNGQTVCAAMSSPTFNFYNTGFNLTQILFDFGQNLNTIRAAQASEQSLAADRSTQFDTVVLNAKQAYFNVLAARRLLAVADETVRQNQKHLEQAQGRFNVGVAAKFDVTQAQVQVAQAELNQVTARNNVAIARETLRNALGLTSPIDFDIVDNFDVHAVAITEEQALAMAYDKRPEVQSIQAQERSTTEQIKSLQKNYLPNVTGNGNYYWSGSDYPLQSNWNIGASVNLSLFNGGLTTAQVGEQRANLLNLKYNEEVLRQNIALEVRQAVLNLQQAGESIRVSEKGLQQARENLDLAEGRYGTGVGNIIELTDAQVLLTTAEANYVQALYSYKTAVAALEKATAQQLATE
ncbi:MAG TPA: TolC family protein [Candidatus Kryptonia bacterium]|nr:TolC family protein [Candidatus Kryptonia bacterium]